MLLSTSGVFSLTYRVGSSSFCPANPFTLPLPVVATGFCFLSLPLLLLPTHLLLKGLASLLFFLLLLLQTIVVQEVLVVLVNLVAYVSLVFLALFYVYPLLEVTQTCGGL